MKNGDLVIVPSVRGEIVGTKETEDAIDLIIGLENAIRLARADGKIDFADAGLIFALTPNLLAAIQGGENIPIELGDLSQEEIDQLFVKYGERIKNDNYRRALYGLAILSDAVNDEIKQRKAA